MRATKVDRGWMLSRIEGVCVCTSGHVGMYILIPPSGRRVCSRYLIGLSRDLLSHLHTVETRLLAHSRDSMIITNNIHLVTDACCLNRLD